MTKCDLRIRAEPIRLKNICPRSKLWKTQFLGNALIGLFFVPGNLNEEICLDMHRTFNCARFAALPTTNLLTMQQHLGTGYTLIICTNVCIVLVLLSGDRRNLI